MYPISQMNLQIQLLSRKLPDLNVKFSPSLITHYWGICWRLTVHKLNTVTISKPRTRIPRAQHSNSVFHQSFPGKILFTSNLIDKKIHYLPTYPLICLSHSIELNYLRWDFTLQDQLSKVSVREDNITLLFDRFQQSIMDRKLLVLSLLFIGWRSVCWTSRGGFRICFKETERSSQCQGPSHTCSGWSCSPAWSQPFRDDTDNRGGGCYYQWRVEAQGTIDPKMEYRLCFRETEGSSQCQGIRS